MTEAHETGFFAELVCSNSLRASGLENAVGLLKAEMAMFDSLIMKAAIDTQVKAGGALAVDRQAFAEYITRELQNNENIKVIRDEVTKIPDGPTIIATGPLTIRLSLMISRIFLVKVNTYTSLTQWLRLF